MTKRSPFYRSVIALASTLAPVLLVGCGGGNSGPSVRPTPLPTSVPGGPYRLRGALDFSGAAPGSPFDAAALTAFDDLSDAGFLRTLTTDEGVLQFARFSGKRSAFGPTARTLNVGIGLTSIEENERPYVPFVAGRTFVLKPQEINQFYNLYVDGVRMDLGDGTFYRSVSGQIKVLAVGPDSLTLGLTGVRMETLRAAHFDSFQLDGTLAVGGLSVFSLRTQAAKN